MTMKSLATLRPLTTHTGLASTPTGKLKYACKIRNKQGEEITVGDPRATRALVALMNQHAVIGGAACHWGGPSAFAEIMSAVHALMFKSTGQWHEHYNFVNDAGHTENGLYALRANYGFDQLTFDHLKKFRSIESKLTGHGEAHLNPQGVLISNGPLGSGLPQAQGLALADRLTGNKRTTICTISDGACMEGEAKESFAAIPGLAIKGALNPFVMLISDNNTKLTGRIDADAFSMTPTFESLENLGWCLIKIDEGHNLERVYQAIEEAIDLAKMRPEKPVAVWFKTIKGKGNKATEESKSGGHGYPLKAFDQGLAGFIQEIYQADAPNEFIQWANQLVASKPAAASSSSTSAVKSEKVQVGLSKALISNAKEGLPVFSISADLPGSTGVAEFQKEMSSHWVDVGVAESNMISTAAGLSRAGLIPIVDTFAQFGVTKGNLPITMANLSLAPIIGLFSHTGLQDAADGASHQATTYFSATASIPHTTLLSVASSSEAEFFLNAAIKQFAKMRQEQKVPDSYLFFYGRENFPAHYGNNNYSWGKPVILQEGKDIMLVGTGPTVAQALEAARLLKLKGIEATVVNHVFINQPCIATFSRLLQNCGHKMVTMEDHQAQAGMGALLCHALTQSQVSFKAKSLGIKGQFGQSAYLAEQLYQQFGISAGDMAKAAQELI